MRQAYKNLGYFFIALFIITLAGFYKTYIGIAPQFKGLTPFAHIHFAAFTLWFALLITQPFLIKNNKVKLHRILGKASYFLVPILVVTANEMQKIGFERDILLYPRPAVLSGLLLTYLDLFFFVTCYIVAMVYRKKLAVHICFIIGTSLILLGPGLGRLIGQTLGKDVALLTAAIAPRLIIIGFMIFEKVKLKRGILQSPFLLLFGLFMLKLILFFILPTSSFWLWTADKIVKYFY